MGILINSFCIPQIHLSHYILLPPHVTSSEEISPCSEAFPRCGPPVVRLLITPVYSLPWPPHPGLSPADLISLCSPPSLLQPPWPLALLQHTNFTPASRPSCVLSALSRRSFQVLPGSLPNSVPSSAQMSPLQSALSCPQVWVTHLLSCQQTRPLYLTLLFLIALISTWNCILFTRLYFLTLVPLLCRLCEGREVWGPSPYS